MPYKTASALFDHPVLKLGQPTQDLHPEWASGDDDGSLLRDIMTRVHWRRFLQGYKTVLCIGEGIISELVADTATTVSMGLLIKLVNGANIGCIAGFGQMQRSVCVLLESLRSRSNRSC